MSRTLRRQRRAVLGRSAGDGQRALFLLLNETWACLPTCSKANLLTPGCGGGKCSVCCKAKQGYQWLEHKRPELPDGFQRRVFAFNFYWSIVDL